MNARFRVRQLSVARGDWKCGSGKIGTVENAGVEKAGVETSGKIDTAECYAGVCREKNGEIIFEEFQRILSQSTNVTNRRTDRRTTYHGNTALCYASNGSSVVENCHFYRAMHFSAYARSHVVCPSVHPSVCLSVRPSVCDVGDLWSPRLEILETNSTDN